MKEEIFKTLSSYKKTLEEKGYNVIYIGLYGSQNYNCSDELSDIDAKVIVMPSLEDIINRKVMSLTIEMENGSCDVKDLLTFYDVIRKGNFSYIEAIETEYCIGDKYIKNLFSQIKVNQKSILGAMYEKRKALTHEYPSKIMEFEKWGFDPKQYHHIIRLCHLLEYGKGSYIIYSGTSKTEMLSVKRNTKNFSKEVVEESSDFYIERAKKEIPVDYKYEPIDLQKEVNEYIYNNVKVDLYKTEFTNARQVRTFNNSIPSTDIKTFPILETSQGKDINYIIYESLEIL